MRKRKMLAGLLAFVMFFSVGMYGPAIKDAKAALAFTDQKHGVAVDYVETAYLRGAVQVSGIAAGATGKVVIPAVVTDHTAVPAPTTHTVLGIADGAFKNGGGVEIVYIQGDVMSLEKGALDGLSETATFVTGSVLTKQALIDYGIPAGRISYQGLMTNYTALGDSLTSGYGLKGYAGDDQPTPKQAYVSLLEQGLNQMVGPGFTNEQGVTGLTSAQLAAYLQTPAASSLLIQSNIITTSLGSNDVLAPFQAVIVTAIQNHFKVTSDDPQIAFGEVMQQIQDALEEVEKDKSLASIQVLVGLLGNLNAMLTEINTNLEGGNNQDIQTAIAQFQGAQQVILQELGKKASNATIYWNNIYNPYSKQTLQVKKDFMWLLPLIDQLPLITDQEKAAMKAVITTMPDVALGDLAEPYVTEINKIINAPKGYYPVDVYSAFVEPGRTNANLENLEFDPHPNDNGHAAIATAYGEVIRDNPYKYFEPEPDISSEKAITAFEVAGVQGTIDEAAYKITVTVPADTDLTKLAAKFTASDKATVSVGGEPQISGETINDFSKPVVYTVTAEDTTTQDYTVEVTKQAAPPVDPNNNNQTDPNQANGSVKTGITSENAGVPAVAITLALLSGLLIYSRKRRSM